MNQMSSRNRKFVYMAVILALLVPIAWLGMPATSPGSGGKIAQLRDEYRLGEATLGNVDPSSATMNLVLLGMRGIAGSVLWIQAEEQKKTKNWSELESTIESIIKLQPRFMGVWKYQSWNLAYNVSAECDAVEDRFFWVKKGAKFLLRGIDQNNQQAELPYYAGEFFGKKIGRSDERVQFRQFFKSDPDPRFLKLADKDLNPDGKDNYLVAKDYYLQANDKERLEGVEQHISAPPLFRAYPWRSQMDYANALYDDGIFGEVPLEAWLTANNEWRTIYGRERFMTPGGDVEFEASRDEIYQMADADGIDREMKLKWQDRYHKMVNYTYWRTRSEVEAQRDMAEARQAMHQGKEKFFDSHFEDIVKDGVVVEKGAKTLLEEGLTRLQRLEVQYPDLITTEDELVEDVLKTILMWRHVVELLTGVPPENFPLKEQIWDKHPEKREDLEENFQNKINVSF